MGNDTKGEMKEALQVVSSTISRCEKAQQKFAEGTSQHSLLKNRLNALYISKSLITGEYKADLYQKEALLNALPPIVSVINKCEKAQQKFAKNTAHYARFQKIIHAMTISKLLIEEKLG